MAILPATAAQERSSSAIRHQEKRDRNTSGWIAGVLHRHAAPLVILMCVTLLMIFLYGQIAYNREPYAGWDLGKYRVMAQAAPGLALTGRPFAYRLLGPYLVGLLPVPDPAGFYGLAVIASFVLVILFYFFLIGEGIQRTAAVITVTFLIFNEYFFGMTLFDYFQINDLLTLIFLIGLFWAMFKSRWPLFGVFLALGALARETSLLMIPVALVYLLETGRLRREGLPFALSSVPGAVIFTMIHAFAPVSGGMGLLEAPWAYRAKVISPVIWFRLLVNSFIPLSLLPAIYFKLTLEFFTRRKYALLFVGLVLASTFFGVNNERLMAPTFIVFYLLIAEITQTSLYPRWGILIIMLGCGFVSSFHPLIARYPLPNNLTYVVLSLATLGMATAATAWGRWGEVQTRSSDPWTGSTSKYGSSS